MSAELTKEDYEVCPLCRRIVEKVDLRVDKRIREKACGKCRAKL